MADVIRIIKIMELNHVDNGIRKEVPPETPYQLTFRCLTSPREIERRSSSRTNLSRWRIGAILGGLRALGPLSIDAYLPAMPAMATDFHASQGSIQLSLRAFTSASPSASSYMASIGPRRWQAADLFGPWPLHARVDCLSSAAVRLPAGLSAACLMVHRHQWLPRSQRAG